MVSSPFVGYPVDVNGCWSDIHVVAMQEKELIKAEIAAGNDQDDEQQQLGAKPRFIRRDSNMSPDTSDSGAANITNNNPNDSANKHSAQPPSLRCPRCDSPNTKFCYYNNYSLLQPRYFCKSCRRYWTKGGTLRSVPVGGGCRKNKRMATGQTAGAASDLISPSSSTSFLFDPHLAGRLQPHAPFSSFADHGYHTARHAPSFSLPSPSPNFLHFNVPPNEQLIKDNPPFNPSFSTPPLLPSGPHELPPSAGPFSRQLATYLPSSVASHYLSNVGTFPSQNFQGFADNYLSSTAAPAGAADHLALLHHNPFDSSNGPASTPAGIDSSTPTGWTTSTDAYHGSSNIEFKSFSLPFDKLGTEEHENQLWATTRVIPCEHKLLTDQKVNRMDGPAMDSEDSIQEGLGRLFTQLRSHTLQTPKVEDVCPSQQHDQVTSSSGVDNAAASQTGNNHWISGGWNNMSGYAPGADNPFM